jgi:hypothetical protein
MTTFSVVILLFIALGLLYGAGLTFAQRNRAANFRNTSETFRVGHNDKAYMVFEKESSSSIAMEGDEANVIDLDDAKRRRSEASQRQAISDGEQSKGD